MFQPRKIVGQICEEHLVLREIEAAIKRHDGDNIDPVVVWWSGKHWYCVDGHHRIEAFQRHNRKIQAKATKKTKGKQKRSAKTLLVPVVIFRGTLSDALSVATEENGKARLSMRKVDRVNWAWRQQTLHLGGIFEGPWNKTKRSHSLHVARRTLSEMHSAYHQDYHQ